MPGCGKATCAKNSGCKLKFVKPYNSMYQDLKKEITIV